VFASIQQDLKLAARNISLNAHIKKVKIDLKTGLFLHARLATHAYTFLDNVRLDR